MAGKVRNAFQGTPVTFENAGKSLDGFHRNPVPVSIVHWKEDDHDEKFTAEKQFMVERCT